MSECQTPPQDQNCSPTDIQTYHVSEDGVRWRAYDPERDQGRLLHKRIVFAPNED